MKELRVELGDRSYPVHVGSGLLERLAELIPAPPAVEKIALFADEVFSEQIATAPDSGPGSLPTLRLDRGLKPISRDVRRISMRGEGSKSTTTLDAVWRWLAVNGLHRGDLVVAFGGGVIGDVAGFAAATYNRGLPWVAVPTTLLAMVDASIGGKTAIDLPQGKNLVGAFHQPLAVVADTTVLASLPEDELRTGMAEAIKHGLIADPQILRTAGESRDAILRRDPGALEELVGDAAAVKVAVVSKDETEQGERAFLNYGHTLGHALETLGGYERWTHGQAVAIGMVFAARLGAALGHADLVDAHTEALGAYGLPVGGAGVTYDEIAAVWQRDKKYRHGTRFVVLEDIGRPVLVGDVPEDALRAAFEAVR